MSASQPPSRQPETRPPTATRRSRTTVLVAGGLVAVAAVAGVWAAGRVGGGQPILPFTGTAERSPVPAAGPTGPADDPAASTQPAPATTGPEGQRIRYRNLTLTFPADWTVMTFEDVEFRNGSEPDRGSVTDDWVLAHPPGQPGCADWNRQTQWDTGEGIHCAHVKIFGPGGIRYGGEGWQPITEEPDGGAYVPRSGLGMCPSAADPVASPADHHSPTVAETAPVGDRQALYRQYGIACATWDTGDASGYEQRSWLLPESQILVVDEYGITELGDVLAAGEFAPSEEETD